jgi:CRISPR-associated protein Csh1
MLGSMRTLALDYLFQELDGGHPPDNLDSWYQELRANHPEKLFSFLVESVENIEKIYILQADADKDTTKLSVEDMTEEKAFRLPFKQYRARAIGPVIKRAKSKNKVSPNLTTQNATLKYFRKVGESSAPWAGYFREISEILNRPKLKLTDNSVIETGENQSYSNVYSAAMDLIPDTKGTLIVTVADKEGRWPGDRFEYRNYLMSELSLIKYCTNEAPFVKDKICPLCGALGVTVFPNALKGAGINLTNMDREGAFPGLDLSSAWKGYALCSPCADLLYVYKYHVLKKTGPKKDLTPFTARIAGESALIIPFSTMKASARQDLLKKVNKFIKNIPADVEADEETLLDILKDEKGILNLTFLWTEKGIGQNLEKVTGILTDVPPTRLRQLSQINEHAKNWKHPLFPEISLVSGRFDLRADLSLKALSPLFYRPGGKKAQNANNSKRLFQLKRDVAAAVYHKTHIPSQRFWDEVMETARWWCLQSIENKDGYKSLLYEGKGKKGPYPTAAGWIRHMVWWIYYFRCLEVLEMNDYFFEPEMVSLKPYFGTESGINSPEKAYAFLLGALYGRLLEIQGGKGVNVGANALTWLKRLTLKGKDLPELYVKIREKLLAYEAEKSQKVRDLINEIGVIGVKLGDPIELSQTQTNYYLLLGQSMTRTILK